MSSEPIAPRRSFPRANPLLTTARVSLGLTVYTADAPTWAREGAVRLFDAFRARVPDWRMRWLMTSRRSEWTPIGDGTIDEIRRDLSVGAMSGRVRHLFEVSIADIPGSCHAGFTYREVDDSRSPGTGYAQVFLPRRTSADELLALAIEVGQELPFVAAIGGFVGTYSRAHEREAFQHFHALARRYAGLDLQVPWLAARHVRSGLPSVGWLTMIGRSLEEGAGIDVERLARSAGPGVSVMRLNGGALVRAGELSLGDSNQMELPLELARVSQLLAAHVLGDEPRLPGPFEAEGETERWRRRFELPQAWH